MGLIGKTSLVLGAAAFCGASLALWLHTLHPAMVWYAATEVWDTTLLGLGITWFLSALIRAGNGASPARAFRLGLGFGALLLLNPAPVAFAPAILYYFFRERSARTGALSSLTFCVGAALLCVPWIVRNAIAVGSPGLRSNLGVELMVGNNDGIEPAPIEVQRLVEI